jgi:hypothetical protein
LTREQQASTVVLVVDVVDVVVMVVVGFVGQGAMQDPNDPEFVRTSAQTLPD